jgi:hypothetical protein
VNIIKFLTYDRTVSTLVSTRGTPLSHQYRATCTNEDVPPHIISSLIHLNLLGFQDFTAVIMSIPCISAESVTSQMRDIFACILSKHLLLLLVLQTILPSTQREWAYTQLAFHCINGNSSEISLHPKPNVHCTIPHRLHVSSYNESQ